MAVMAEGLIPFVLIKFGERQYMLDLFEKGIVYMNTVSYFKELEEDDLRRDPHEGIASLEQIISFKFKTESGVVIELTKAGDKPNLNSAQLRKEYPARGNLYCMYNISPEWVDKYDRFDPRCVDFGKSEPFMVVIHKPAIFLKRVREALRLRGLSEQFGEVKYYDPMAYHGELDIFHKSNKFDYQCEFRIYVEEHDDGPLKLEIGPLDDIAYFLKADESIVFKFEDIEIPQ